MVKSNEITVKSFIETFDFSKSYLQAFKVCRDEAILVEVSWTEPLNVSKTDAYMSVLKYDANLLSSRVLSTVYDYIDKSITINV